jgi:predicted Rossmann fold flavoprotein
MLNNREKFDVLVIGGGPAGIMAAGKAAEAGKKTALLERNEFLGRKLLLTGKGRCNLTQIKLSNKEFINKLGINGKFLFSSLAVFGPRETVAFFEERGLKTKEERGGRVFPKSDQAKDVLLVLKKYLEENKVELGLGIKVLGFNLKGGKIESVKTTTGDFCADNFILATGGKAYSATGSDGDGYDWARKIGHTITKIVPALVPIRVKEQWPMKAQGLGLKNVTLSVYADGKKRESRFGELLFTHFGISGPIVLDLSKKISELLANGEVFLEIDLKPALDFVKLDKRLQRDFLENRKKDFGNYLPDLLPKKLIPIVIELSGIEASGKVEAIGREKRRELAKLLKGLKLQVESLLDFNQAIITNGGVSLREIDPKTMRSKIVPNLFLAGEILDLDGPTGGYNLQICWSTGYVAGRAVGEGGVKFLSFLS